MAKNSGEYQGDEELDHLLKQAFGVDDDELLRDFLLAQTEINDTQIPPEPEDGFEKLVKKIEERGIKPCYEAEEDSIESTEFSAQKKHRRLKPMMKVALVAAIAAVMMLAMGITAGAKREYRYTVQERDGVRNEVVLNNVDTVDGKDELHVAYDEIYKQTGINVLKMGYVPNGMKYEKTNIFPGRATMCFIYNENSFTIVQRMQDAGNTTTIISDRQTQDTIYNEWLKQDITIEKAQLEDGDTELSACIVDGDTYYYLCGIIKEKEFKKILQNVYLEN